MSICMSIFDRYRYYMCGTIWCTLKTTMKLYKIIVVPMFLKCVWELAFNHSMTLEFKFQLLPRTGGFNFIIPLHLLMTNRYTNASRMWRIKGPYKASRPVLKGWKNNMTEELNSKDESFKSVAWYKLYDHKTNQEIREEWNIYIYEITVDYTHLLTKYVLTIKNRCIPQLGKVTYIN